MPPVMTNDNRTPATLAVTELNDGKTVELRDIYDIRDIGDMVSAFAGIMMGQSTDEAFGNITKAACDKAGNSRHIEVLAGRITGLDDESISNAVALCGYAKTGIPAKPMTKDEADGRRLMVFRCVVFHENCEKNGITWKIQASDAEPSREDLEDAFGKDIEKTQGRVGIFNPYLNIMCHT